MTAPEYKQIKTIKTGFLTRTFAIDVKSINEEKRTIDISFSSEEPYLRWFGWEILGHDKKEVDLSFMASGSAPFLVQHYTGDQVGVLDSATVGADRKGRAIVRFGKSNRAEEIFTDVKDGIRKNISVGYNILKMRLEKEDAENGDTYRVVSWKPLEASLVAIPADETVGVGRAVIARQHKFPDVETIILGRAADLPAAADREGEPMATPNQTAAPDTGAPETRTQPAPSIDVARIEAETRAAEKARVSEIIALGETHNFRDEAMKAISDGRSIENFRQFVLDGLANRGTVTPVNRTADIGLSNGETRQFSFLRALNALANPTDRAAQEAAAFEFECSRAVQTQMKKTASGIMVPYEVLSRDLEVGTPSAGGYLVATDLLAANFIDILRNRMLTRALGAMIIPGLLGDIAIPKQTGGATFYWVAESGAPTESQQVLGQMPLSPKTGGAWTDISRKLLKQSSIGAEFFVRSDLAATCALGLDLAGLAGTGQNNQPTGILATTGIGDVAGGDNGLAPGWSHIVDLETQVAIDNADVGALAYLTNAKVRGKLKQTEKASGTAQFIYENGNEPGFGLLNGYRAAVSNQVPSDLDKGTSTGVCSAIIFGNWRDLVYGLWGTIDITVDPYTNSTSGTVRVVALQDADVGVRHPQSFAAMQDALTA